MKKKMQPMLKQMQPSTVNPDSIVVVKSTSNIAPARRGSWSAEKEVDGAKIPWTEELQVKFSEFLELEEGWDGYDGNVVEKSTVQKAMSLLTKLYEPKVKTPCVAPNGEGSIILDWFFADFEIMICVNGDSEVEGCLKNLSYDVGDSRRYDECKGANIDRGLPQIKKWFAKVVKV